MSTFWNKLLTNYANCEDRMSRREFWNFILFISLGFAAALLVDLAIISMTHSGWWSFLSLIYFLFTFLPTVCAMIRRLHDTGRSGKWLLIGLVPIVGAAFIIFLFLKKSQKRKYGKS